MVGRALPTPSRLALGRRSMGLLVVLGLTGFVPVGARAQAFEASGEVVEGTVAQPAERPEAPSETEAERGAAAIFDAVTVVGDKVERPVGEIAGTADGFGAMLRGEQALQGEGLQCLRVIRRYH